MRINLALWDRVIRYIIGFIFTAWAVAGGPWWAFLGIYFILSASWGFCLIYGMFKIRTSKIDKRLLEQID